MIRLRAVASTSAGCEFDMQYRPDIDGLRAVAVLSVVLCHAGLGCSGGFVGVDVFFVISGYLITCLMLKDLDAGKFSLVHFWERRVRRILPALAVVVGASFVAGWFLLAPTAYLAFGYSVCELVLLKANIHFSHSTGYFAAATEEMPLLHTWSLAVEEQFYLFVPLLFWGIVRWGRRSWLELLVGVMIIVSFIAALYGTATEDHAAYYRLPTRAWELLAGVGLALRLRNGAATPLALYPRLRELIAVVGLAAIVLPCFFYDKHTPFPGIATLPPVLGAMALIACGGSASPQTCVHRFLALRSVVYVGLISYSLYLWHWPVLVFFKHYNILTPTTLERVLLVLAAVGLAIATYRWIETPFRRGALLVSRPRLLVAAVVVMVAFHSGGKMLRKTNGGDDRLSQEALAFAATGERADQWMFYHVAADVPEKLLRVGAEEGEPELLIWGDSHAVSMMPAVDRVCRAAGVSACAVVHPAWSPAVEHLSAGSPKVYAEAMALSDAVHRYLKTDGPRNVILAAHWNRYRAHPRFREALLQTVDDLRASGCRVYFMKDVPEYDYDVVARLVQCAWHGRDKTVVKITVPEYGEKNRYYDVLLPELVAHGAEILDPIPGMLQYTRTADLRACDADGMFYQDWNHLSMHGSKLVDSMLYPMVESIAARRPSGRPSPRESLQPALTAERPARTAR